MPAIISIPPPYISRTHSSSMEISCSLVIAIVIGALLIGLAIYAYITRR